MRWAIISALALASSLAAYGEAQLPAQAGESVSLADDDFQLKLETSHEWVVEAPEAAAGRQIVLGFRARIDHPGTIGSCNALSIAVNGEAVRLKSPRRQLRLLNKPNRFEWSNPPELTWYLLSWVWRLSYAPDFEILLDREYHGPLAYAFELDVSDLIVEGENVIELEHAGNKAIAANAGSDLTLYFRDLRLDVREGPGVLPGEPNRRDNSEPFQPRETRSAGISWTQRADGIETEVRGHRYGLTSRFSAPGDDGTVWLTLDGEGRLRSEGWTLRREIEDRTADGRLLISDTFTSVADEPVGIRVEHALQLPDGGGGIVNFGGDDDPNIDKAILAMTPYLFLPREDHGIALVVSDDVLRNQASFVYDDAGARGIIRDDWFGLRPGESYTMTWAVYATDTPNVFDLVNMIREDWLEPFALEGGVNFFDPDAVLAYDDEELRAHLELLNINITMSQGGWLDRKLRLAGTPNIGHGPIVASDLYADYRVRLRAAIEKLHRLRPGIKCLIYYDARLVSGDGIRERYADSLVLNKDGAPRMYRETTSFGMPMATVCPTLDNSLGREIMAKIPTMILDEIGADGLFWDEIGFGFAGGPDYGRTDGRTFEIDAESGRIVGEVCVPELAMHEFKLALLDAFEQQGALVVGNGPPGTRAEALRPTLRFTENGLARWGKIMMRTLLSTPVSYASYPVYHAPGVTEEDFLVDIRDKVWHANLFLFPSPMFYALFTHENLTTYQYPITPIELDWGVIIGRERIVTIRPGRFGWSGERWSGEVVYFDKDQRVRATNNVVAGADGFIDVQFDSDEAAVIIRDDR